MRLIQYIDENERRQVAVIDDTGIAHPIERFQNVRSMALHAYDEQTTLRDLVRGHISDTEIDYDAIVRERRLLVPLDHDDPAHCILSGTGLDHLGSAQARDSMHQKLSTSEREELTDSMKMFKLGLEGGKPLAGQIGVQPEWFYKGDGSWLTPPEQPLTMPSFALDGSEEPELVGLYVVAPDGAVLRVGFALGNEFSDHVLEKQNYLYLAHSKLRASSFGPELLIDRNGRRSRHPILDDIRGTVRINRNGSPVWTAEFLTGEANMTHSIANIEHHHFKYPQFRRPGDVHCHYFGTATLSFAAGITVQPGDVFEIESQIFGRPLRNPLQAAAGEPRLQSVVTL